MKASIDWFREINGCSTRMNVACAFADWRGAYANISLNPGIAYKHTTVVSAVRAITREYDGNTTNRARLTDAIFVARCGDWKLSALTPHRGLGTGSRLPPTKPCKNLINCSNSRWKIQLTGKTNNRWSQIRYYSGGRKNILFFNVSTYFKNGPLN